MVKLPRKFLKWNYYPRQLLARQMLKGEMGDPNKFFLEFMRHNPVLCTAAVNSDGSVEVNGKVVGVGYVLKREIFSEALKEFRDHMKVSDEVYEKVKGDREAMRKLLEEHSVRGLQLMLKYVYKPEGEAEKFVDFEKLATVELAKRLPWSSKHTWNIVQRSRNACLVFFQPPMISFEVRGIIDVYIDGEYQELITLIHDAYHYTPPEYRRDRPVYIVNVTEVYDNSPSRGGFGTKIA